MQKHEMFLIHKHRNIEKILTDSKVIKYSMFYLITSHTHLSLYVYMISCDSKTFRYKNTKSYTHNDEKMIKIC